MTQVDYFEYYLEKNCAVKYDYQLYLTTSFGNADSSFRLYFLYIWQIYKKGRKEKNENVYIILMNK